MTQALDTLTDAGFNVAEAMGRLGGNQKLYMTVLSSFHKQYADLIPKLEASLAAGNMDDIVLQAHTVKGLAGSIGHSGLQAAALELEMAARHNHDAVSGAMEPFKKSLGEVIDTLGRALQ